MFGQHRDPQLWDNPLEFRPERFLNDGIAIKFDYSSNYFQYLPFHSGRRKCAGVALGERMLMSVLAFAIAPVWVTIADRHKARLIWKAWDLSLRKKSHWLLFQHQDYQIQSSISKIKMVVMILFPIVLEDFYFIWSSIICPWLLVFQWHNLSSYVLVFSRS